MEQLKVIYVKISNKTRKAKECICQNVVIQTESIRRLVQINERMKMTNVRISDTTKKAGECIS